MLELFEKYAPWKILEYFAINCSKEVYLKELSRTLDLSPGSCSKILKDLVNLQILQKRDSGREHYYKLSNNYLTKELKRFVGLSVIHDAGLVSKIVEEFEGPTSIALYGSFSTGEFNEGSDVDVLIIASKKNLANLYSLEKTIGRDINLQVFSIGEWLMMKEENSPFYSTVIKNYIVLYGSELP
jgi:predicted nucleotidyltransferase